MLKADIIKIIRDEEHEHYRRVLGYEKTFGQDSEQCIRAENQWVVLIKLTNKLGIETI